MADSNTITVEFNFKMIEELMSELADLDLAEETELYKFWELLSTFHDNNPNRERKMYIINDNNRILP